MSEDGRCYDDHLSLRSSATACRSFHTTSVKCEEVCRVGTKGGIVQERWPFVASILRFAMLVNGEQTGRTGTGRTGRTGRAVRFTLGPRQR